MPELNTAQMAAVTAPMKPTLVLAGAGSGKTRVIVERILWLIEEQGVDPRNILALTFTNRAARELRGRVQRRLGQERLSLWGGTFHSFGLHLLRRHMDCLGRPRQFTIYDDADQLSLMKALVKELPKTFAQVSPRQALQYVSAIKQRQGELEEGEPGDAEEEAMMELWRRYHARLAVASAVDFDDLLVLPTRILTEHEEVRLRYRDRYRHILVDEYQDTNPVQYALVRHLSGEHGSVFVVGDEDQSIYSWRGADIRNILSFEKDFPQASVFRLEQNYRSTKAILDVCNAVVSHNEQRLGKTLWTAIKGGDKVRLIEAMDGEDEATHVTEQISKHGMPFGETAVLFRTNMQARVIEEAFLKRGIPYTVVGGVRFYSRKEIKDILAYLRILVNPLDDVSTARIINVPARGIGGVTLGRLVENGRARGTSLFRAARDAALDESVGSGTRDRIEAFVTMIDDLAMAASTESVGDVVNLMLERTGYREFVQKSDEADFRTRLELIDDFVAGCREYDKKEGGKLAQYLQDLALMTDVDTLPEDGQAVTLMTCHAAKGLEFDHVFLLGLEDGLLPHAAALEYGESGHSMEEERRLCYVAMTRARKTLTLCRASRRMIYGTTEERRPSPFLDEIPRELLEGGLPESRKVMERPARGMDQDVSGARMGARVRHARFGAGRIMYTSGSGEKLKARIRFDTGGTKEFVLSKAPIEIVKGR